MILFIYILYYTAYKKVRIFYIRIFLKELLISFHSSLIITK